MVFSSPLFLYLFLPIVLHAYYFAPKAARNAFLFAASLFFYAWGEQQYILALLGSLGANFGLACAIGRARRSSTRRWCLTAAIVFNLGLLIAFKYLSFVLHNVSALWAMAGGDTFASKPLHMPIGVSFFTFQAMSYVVNVYRREVPAQRNFLHFGLYVFLFPHLIAGPIVRYRDIADQLAERQPNSEQFADGIRRFIVGLAKKMLLANTLAAAADAIFKLPPSELSTGTAWFGMACYALQIYFDFSGYSDMAIGLGKMFGFTFLENFRYPYVAASVTEFWRRWHVSLSSWFRDYVYVPLGGNRNGARRTYANLMIVFLLCGLWHGASWTFLFWGLFHGTFLVIERLGFGNVLKRSWPPFRHVYTLLAVMIGWVFFRCDSLRDSAGFLSALLGFGSARYQFADFWNREAALALFVAVPACLPIVPWLTAWRKRLVERGRWSAVVEGAWSFGSIVAVGACMFVASVQLAANTYQPFIYFRF